MRANTRVPAKPNVMTDNFAIEMAICRSPYSFYKFAELIGVSRHTLRLRLDDGNWSVMEAYKVCKLLDLDFEKIFFAHPERINEAA